MSFEGEQSLFLWRFPSVDIIPWGSLYERQTPFLGREYEEIWFSLKVFNETLKLKLVGKVNKDEILRVENPFRNYNPYASCQLIVCEFYAF